MRTITLLLALVLASCTRTPEVPALVYRVSNGNQPVGHLLGTIHFGVALKGRDRTRIEDLVSKASVLAVERDFADQSFDPRFAEAISAPLTGKYWSDLVPGPEGLRAVSRLGMSAGVAALGNTPDKLHPFLLVGAAMRPCDPEKLKHGGHMDADIQDAARKRQIPILPLETPMDMAKPIASIPLAVWKNYLAQADQFIAASSVCKTVVSTYVDTLIASYGNKDLEGIRAATARLHEATGLTLVHGQFVFGRETALIDNLVARFQSGPGPVVAMVGAIHLAGQGGAVERLRRAGFTVVADSAKD